MMCLGFSAIANAKDSTQTQITPIPLELFAGDEGLVFQMIVAKKFAPESRYGFFSVNNFFGDYSRANPQNELLSQAFATADIAYGISLLGGVSINNFTGWGPTAGLQYLFVNKNLLAIILPRYELGQEAHVEVFGLLEYRPRLTETWGIYSRVQAMYNQNVSTSAHDRSFVWLRAGVSYKNLQFGLGANLDYFGPEIKNQYSVGGFIRTELF